jgi:hypothetical protein
MEGRVGGGLESAGVPRSPLHVVFVDFERGVAPSFMESIEPIEAAGIIPHVKVMAEITLQTAEDAKKFGELKDDWLSVDFAAVLMKYSEEDTKPALYADMNARCYDRDRTKMVPYSKFVWLLLHAMQALAPYPQTATVFRGVKLNLGAIYAKGRELTWHGFASCTKSMGVLMNEQFCGPSGPRTIFVIELTQAQAREITRYSLNAREEEVLLPPGCRFSVIDTAPMADGLLIVQLREVASKEWIVDLASRTVSRSRCHVRERICAHARTSCITHAHATQGMRSAERGLARTRACAQRQRCQRRVLVRCMELASPQPPTESTSETLPAPAAAALSTAAAAGAAAAGAPSAAAVVVVESDDSDDEPIAKKAKTSSTAKDAAPKCVLCMLAWMGYCRYGTCVGTISICMHGTRGRVHVCV